MRALVTLFTALLFAAQAAFAATYQWTDDQGVVHFTDDPDKVPARYMKRVKKRESVEPERTLPVQIEQEKVISTVPVEEKALYGGHDEEWWRGSYKKLRDEFKGIQEKLPEKRESLENLRRRWRIFRGATDRAAYNAMKAEIEKNEARIKELEEQLSALEAEAAMAGVPAGWRQ